MPSAIRVLDQFAALADVHAPDLVGGALLYWDGAMAKARAIQAVAAGQVLASQGVGAAPAFTAAPVLSGLTVPSIAGGDAANDDLTLQGTTHATRTTSHVLLQPSGGFVGVGVSGPTVELEVAGKVLITAPYNNTAPLFLRSTSPWMAWRDTDRPNDETWYFGITGAAPVGGLVYQYNDSLTGSLNVLVLSQQGLVGIATAPVLSGTGKLHMAGDTMRLDTARTPASAGAAGNAGEWCWDADYLYVCIATNTWRRIPHVTWP